MDWVELFEEAGLTDREAKSLVLLSSSKELKASDLAKKLGTNRLDAYNSLSRLTQIGLVNVTADRPMKFSCSSLPVLFKKLIKDQKSRIDRTTKAFENIMSGATDEALESEAQQGDASAKFAVLKGRDHIQKRIGELANEADGQLVLFLGKYGILHMCRSPSIEEVNSAAERGVMIKVLAQLDKRTLKFFDQLHDSIEIRHSDEVNSLGVLKDQSDVIQFLFVEQNPVGRGREDAGLVVSSEVFAASHYEFMMAIWNRAVDFNSAKKRFTEEKIVDPLRLTVGDGSFLEQFRDALNFSGELPDEDTPFNPDSFLASSNEINQARAALQDGTVFSLHQLGIDIKTMLRQVGHRIGEELAFSLRKIDGHVEFLSELMDWWEYAGLGELEYDTVPFFHIKVNLTHPPVEKADVLPLWELDDGIIEGALRSRYPEDSNVRIRRETAQGEDELWRYTLIFVDDSED
ncbi:MAG: helix-turn-helix domain-containing protein [Candidatus Poseidoniaceae archaeon]|tara:strand:- start:1741 stop:3123 length:1383 start_codon:yes stop_codon:yes gene_type:complete